MYFMKNLKLLAFIFMSITLVGCGTTPKGSLYTASPEVKNGKAQIVFYSYPEVNAFAYTATIKNNGQEIGQLINGQFLVLDIEPGSHKIWGDSKLIDTPLEMDVEAGKTYYLRYISKYIPYASRTWLKPVEEIAATEELSKCCLDGIEK